MDNNMNPFNPQQSNRPINPVNNPATAATPQSPAEATSSEAQLPPAAQVETQSSGAFQQVQTAPLDANGPTVNNTGVKLESPILGPTHFDIPASVSQPPMSATPQNQQSTDAQKAKTYMTLSVVFGIFAFVGIILGIYSLVSNTSTSSQLAEAEAALNNASAIISKVESDTGKTINSVDDVPSYTSVANTIYVPEWGIKFKVPDDLENVSYIVDQKYRPQICFTAHKTGVKYFPAFADIDQNPGGLGCITRVAITEGDSDKDSGNSFGQKIYSYGEYNYFYTAPSGHFSQDSAEQGLEDTATQIIKNMIANNISHYE